MQLAHTPERLAIPAGRTGAIIAALFAAMFGAAVLRLCLGATFGLPDATLLTLRLSDVMAAGAAGFMLAVSGVGLQALLRNPLAEPYILGLSSGAALGVMVQAIIRLELGLAAGANHLGAIGGAMVTMAVVFLAGRRRGVIDPLGLLLTGVVLMTINGALVMLLNYWVGPGGIKENVSQWMMGYLTQSLSLTQIGFVGATGLVGLGILLAIAPAMDVASFSDAEAISMGVNLRRLRTTLFVVSSVLAAGAVVLAGPIAFIGLVSPHIARLLLGPGHDTLLIASALIGATLLILANCASIAVNNAFETGILPIGAFAALLGGPVFLWMLRPHLGRGVS